MVAARPHKAPTRLHALTALHGSCSTYQRFCHHHRNLLTIPPTHSSTPLSLQAVTPTAGSPHAAAMHRRGQPAQQHMVLDEDGVEPKHATATAPRRRRRCITPTVLIVACVTLVVLIVLGMHSAPVGASEVTATPSGVVPTRPAVRPPAAQSRLAPPGQYAVSSSEELRRVCHEQAPELENTTWSINDRTFSSRSWLNRFLTGAELGIVHGRSPSRHRYFFMPYPVCLHLDTGRMFAEHAQERINRSRENYKEIPLYLRDTGFHDLEDLFSYMKNSGSANDSTVQLIPAMSVVPFGFYMASHMWHLIYDGIGPFTNAIHSAADEFWNVPRQGVLVDEQRKRWLNRGGDLPDKMRLSAYILNGFSTFTANTSSSDPNAPPVPAFVRTPLIAHSVDHPPPVLDGSVQDLVSRTVCFCQNAFLPSYGEAGNPPSSEAISVIQDRTALSFGAPPYRPLSQESVWAIERQRVERYPPWARQFWPSSGTSSDYQPRVLFIHRARRTIANVSTYVTVMREMGFRVEEAYLERLPTEQQYYLGRYADVVVGMHGLGVGHALWMNRYPAGCRTVIEFRLWAAKGVPLGLEDILRRRAGFHYVTPEPIDVIFGPTVKDPLDARKQIKALGHGGYKHPGWDDQEAVFNIAEVVATLQDVKLHLSKCLISGHSPH